MADLQVNENISTCNTAAIPQDTPHRAVFPDQPAATKTDTIRPIMEIPPTTARYKMKLALRFSRRSRLYPIRTRKKAVRPACPRAAIREKLASSFGNNPASVKEASPQS